MAAPTQNTPYRHQSTGAPSPIAANINASDEARRIAHAEKTRAKSAMEEAGWDTSIEDADAHLLRVHLEQTEQMQVKTEAQLRAAARIEETRRRDKEHKANWTAKRARERERGVEIAKTEDLARRLAAATTEDGTMHKPLLALEWEDSPGLMTATDGNLLFALKRRGEAEWSVTMGVADKDVPGLDLLAVQIVSSHKSHCEALEYAEGLRAGWYVSRQMGRSE